MKTFPAIFLLALLTSCAGLNTASQEHRLQTQLFEELLQENAKPSEICYLARDWKYDDQLQILCTDPPHAVVQHFIGRSYRIRPGSSYPLKSRFEVTRNPKTGVPDGIYAIRILRWIEPKRAEVRIAFYRTPLQGFFREMIVEETDGVWHATKVLREAIS